MHGSVAVVATGPDAGQPGRPDDVEVGPDDEELAAEADEQDRLVAQDASALLGGTGVLDGPAALA